MKFLSVCSGIEAASVAWEPLGWKPVGFSEIEPFPSALLRHYYPQTFNFGDMTQLVELLEMGLVELPDLLCGGTPCQAFSVAGLRRSLADDRGNLSLVFCEIANAIDRERAAAGLVPGIVFWENVPGVLNTRDNAFGCFLAGLAGESEPLVPAGGKWTNAGCVFGPERAVAWRVLDAQYFGVAQRRRRVFVVASARDGFDPAAILFEREGVRRDTPPSREAGKATAAGAGTSAARGCESRISWPAEVTSTLDAHFGDKPGLEDQHINQGAPLFVPAAYGIPGNWIGRAPENGGNATEPMHDVAPCLTGADRHGVAAPIPINADADRSNSSALTPSPDAEGRMRLRDPGLGVGQPGDPMFTLQATKPHAVAFAIQAGALRTNPDSGPDGVGVQADYAYTLEARSEVQCVAHSLRSEGFDASEDGTGRGTPLVPVGIYQDSEYGVTRYDSAGTLRAGRIPEHQMVMQPVAFHPTQDPINSSDGTTHAMGCGSKQGSASIAVAFAQNTRNEVRLVNGDGQIVGALAAQPGMKQTSYVAQHLAPTLTASNDPSRSPQSAEETQQVAAVHAVSMAVRRLTPVECERLQGFPDNYTSIPWRGKQEAPDGPRYKALGNSWAVPVVRWIGRRIQQHVEGAA